MVFGTKHAKIESHVLFGKMTMEKRQKTVAEKKEFRQLNRKRKLEAFFNVAVANDRQRLAKQVDTVEPASKRKKNSQRGSRAIIKKEIATIMDETKKKNDSISESKPKLSEEEYKNLKKTLNERKKFLKGQPRFWLREGGKSASLDLPNNQRIPLLLGDIQQLVLFGLVGNHIFQDHNRWCHLEHHGKVSQVVVILLENIGFGDLLEPVKSKKKEEGKSFAEMFPDRVELVCSDAYDRTIVDDFSLVPLSARSCRGIFLKYGSKEAELKSKMFRTAFPIGVVKSTLSIEVAVTEETPTDDKTIAKSPPTPPPTLPSIPASDTFSRIQLLLSPSQMLEENYPMPLGEMAWKYGNYVLTKDRYAEVTPHSPMFGLDCEMCLTTARVNELTRISIVNEQHELVYETLVMPYNKIINYLTQYSGITRQMMIGVKTRLQDVQNDIRKILPPDAVLVGQSLNSDLHAIQMFHPYCIDSSVIFNIHGIRKKKTKLKTLTEMFLGSKIQDGYGHDSVEDAAAALKLVQFKLTKSIEFGDTILGFDLKKFEVDKFGPAKAKLELKRIEEEEAKSEAEEGEETYKVVDVDVPQPEVLKVMEASSLFNIASKKRKVGIFGTPKVIDLYSKYLDHPHDTVSDVIKSGSHGYASDTNYKVVKNTCKEVVKFDLAVSHMQMDISSEKERVRAVNSCIKVFDSVKDNSMVIVIAGGKAKDLEKPESRPGCFVGIKVAPFQKM